MSHEQENVEQLIESWFRLPKLIKSWFRKALLYMVSIGVFIGGIMVIWGAIQWATDYGPNRGRSKIIKGVALIVISLAPSFFA